MGRVLYMFWELIVFGYLSFQGSIYEDFKGNGIFIQDIEN